MRIIAQRRFEDYDKANAYANEQRALWPTARVTVESRTNDYIVFVEVS